MVMLDPKLDYKNVNTEHLIRQGLRLYKDLQISRDDYKAITAKFVAYDLGLTVDGEFFSRITNEKIRDTHLCNMLKNDVREHFGNRLGTKMLEKTLKVFTLTMKSALLHHPMFREHWTELDYDLIKDFIK